MSIDEFAAAIGAAADSVDTVTSTTENAKTTGEELVQQIAQLGMEGARGRTEAVCQRLESEAVPLASQLKTLLEEIQQQALALKDGGLQNSRTSPRTAPEQDSAPLSPPAHDRDAPFKSAGKWSKPPKRTFGDGFNAKYEEWVKTSNGGPAGELEYRVVEPNTGKAVWFDARRVEGSGSGKVEYLLDAKGNYGQFVDDDAGDFKWFFRERGGLDHALDQAERQVRAADGRPVEWWCADESFADVMNDYFDGNMKLSGKIEAVYQPMPDDEGL